MIPHRWKWLPHLETGSTPEGRSYASVREGGSVLTVAAASPDDDPEEVIPYLIEVLGMQYPETDELRFQHSTS